MTIRITSLLQILMKSFPAVELVNLTLHFVGAPPSGRWVLVCEAQSRRGRRSYRETPRPLWMFRILCGAPHFVGAPPSGRWVVVCKA